MQSINKVNERKGKVKGNRKRKQTLHKISLKMYKKYKKSNDLKSN